MDFGKCTCDTKGDYMINMGECTTAESVLSIIEITNTSFVNQDYGFINLPQVKFFDYMLLNLIFNFFQCIKIFPNYGFGEIKPFETKELTLAFSPTTRDIPKYETECEEANTTISFQIIANTIKNLGGINEFDKVES